MRFSTTSELWGRGVCNCDGVVPERSFIHLLSKAWIQCSLMPTAPSEFWKLESCFPSRGCSCIWVWVESSEPPTSPACAAFVLCSRWQAWNKPGTSGGSSAAGCVPGQSLWAPAGMWVSGDPGAWTGYMVGEVYHAALKADMASGAARWTLVKPLGCERWPARWPARLCKVASLMSGPGGALVLPGCPTFCWESEGQSCLQHCGCGELAGSVLTWQHSRMRRGGLSVVWRLVVSKWSLVLLASFTNLVKKYTR